MRVFQSKLIQNKALTNLRNSYSPALLGLAAIAASAQLAQAQAPSRIISGSVWNPPIPVPAGSTQNTSALGSWAPSPINASWNPGPNSSQAFAAQNSVINLGPNGFSASGGGVARAFTGTATPSQVASAQSGLAFNVVVPSTTQVAYSYGLTHGPNAASYSQYISEFQIGSFYASKTTLGSINSSGLLTLTPGSYTVGANALVSSMANSSTTLATPGLAEWFMDVREWNGTTQSTAFQPTVISPGRFQFASLPGRRWFDPIAATGFEFTMGSPSTYFTQAGMPIGLGDANSSYWLSYLDGSTPTGALVASGATFNFPANVSTFTVTDIFPTVDGEDPLEFPIFLDFSTPTADFTMSAISAIPEPASMLSTLAFVFSGLLIRRRGKTQTS